MDDTSDLHRTVDDKRVKRPEADDSGVLVPVKESAPAASDNNSAVDVAAPYCDDCMRIDWENGACISLAKRETCPMCSFLLTSAVRRGLKITKQTQFFIEPSERYPGSWELCAQPGGRVVILDGCRLGRHENETISDNYPEERAYRRLVDYQLISEWLVDCVESYDKYCLHGPRVSNLDPILGLQLIDCITRRIIPTSEAVGISYVTLSYVWGAPSDRITDDVEEKNSATALPTRPPRVIEDSLSVVERLGFRYLWVDKYCISQDDEAAKHAQIRRMDRIYARSAITIVAAAGNDENYGLPGVGLRARKPELRFELASVYTEDRIRAPRQLVMYLLPGDDLEISTGSTRGWTYQEALLSRRRLVFTDYQMFFECQTTICDDSHVSSARLRRDNMGCLVFPPPTTHFLGINIWFRINGFLRRKLSYDRDALDAITGILNRCQSESPQNRSVAFLCGLPLAPHTAAELGAKPDKDFESFHKTIVLTQGLLWNGYWADQTIAPLKPEFSPTREGPRRTEFPSWTWVGWKSTSQLVLRVAPWGFDEEHAWKCAIRAVYDGHNTGLGWEEEAKQILEKSALGLHPKFLDIKGYCFDVSVIWRKSGVSVDTPSRSGWVYTKPKACKFSGVPFDNMPQNIFEEVEGKEHHLIALIVAKGQDWGVSMSIRFLLLQPVEYNAPRWVYERVAPGEGWLPAGAPLQAMLEERELRLR